MYQPIQVTGFQCTCEICHHLWLSYRTILPTQCPNRKCKNPTKWNAKGAGKPAPAIPPVVEPPEAEEVPMTQQEKLANLRALMSGQIKIQPEPINLRASLPTGDMVQVEGGWRFTKAAPQYAENGNVYREQIDSTGKRKRTVQVDPDTLEKL